MFHVVSRPVGWFRLIINSANSTLNRIHRSSGPRDRINVDRDHAERYVRHGRLIGDIGGEKDRILSKVLSPLRRVDEFPTEAATWTECLAGESSACGV
jgi:hypothetical protein